LRDGWRLAGRLAASWPSLPSWVWPTGRSDSGSLSRAARRSLGIKRTRLFASIIAASLSPLVILQHVAAAGEDQIIHYIENRQTNLGYLVVFDARLDTVDRPLLSASDDRTR
jgi:hypothetical protein